MDILRCEPGPYTGTGLMSSDDGNQVNGIKVEEVADIKEGEDPEPTASLLIKTEPAVSCLCLCVSRFTDMAQISRIPCPSECFLYAYQFSTRVCC